MDRKEELIRNIMVIMQDSCIPPENLNAARNRLLIELDNYDVMPRCTDLVVVDTASEKYIKLYLAMIRMEGKSEKTIALYGYLLDRYRREIDKPVIEMTALEIRVWLARTQQTASMRTCENYRSYLSSFYAWMSREGIMQSNPMAKIEPIKYEDAVKQAFSDVDIDKLRAFCRNEEERAIIEVLLSSGARVSELCAIDKNDIDLATKSLVIKKGKGGKQRVSYINDVCREHLVRYLSGRSDPCPWLFANRNGKRISKLSVERMLRELGKRANVANVHPHRFRRTFATSLCKKGMDLSTLQTLMGHSDTNTTRSYVSLSQDFIQTQYARYA